jgi:hypothetical protein
MRNCRRFRTILGALSPTVRRSAALAATGALVEPECRTSRTWSTWELRKVDSEWRLTGGPSMTMKL